MSNPAADVDFLRCLVDSGNYVWSNPDREPLDDQNPADESIKNGKVIAVRETTEAEYPYPRGRRIDLGGGAWVTVCGEGPDGLSDEALAELSQFAEYLRECGKMPKDDRPSFKEWKEGQWE